MKLRLIKVLVPNLLFFKCLSKLNKNILSILVNKPPLLKLISALKQALRMDPYKSLKYTLVCYQMLSKMFNLNLVRAQKTHSKSLQGSAFAYVYVVFEKELFFNRPRNETVSENRHI